MTYDEETKSTMDQSESILMAAKRTKADKRQPAIGQLISTTLFVFLWPSRTPCNLVTVNFDPVINDRLASQEKRSSLQAKRVTSRA